MNTRSFVVVLAGLATFAAMLLYNTDTNFLAALIGICALVAFAVDPSKQRFFFALAMTLWSLVVEMAAVHFGAWSYQYPNLFDIPVWIPLMWVVGGYNAIEIHDWISARFKKKKRA